jgi:acyl-CoA thioesterase I
MPVMSILELIAKTRSAVRTVLQQGLLVPICAALLFWAGGAAAKAEHINIVAIGESNTEGFGVGSTNAYPAVLERLLRARGYDVSVKNEGVSGITTAGTLSRLDSAIPDGTKIVILQMSNFNDAMADVRYSQTQANIKEALARARARAPKVIFIPAAMFLAIPLNDYQGDHLHLNEEGHALMAQKILPQVVQAIRSLR